MTDDTPQTETPVPAEAAEPAQPADTKPVDPELRDSVQSIKAIGEDLRG